MVCIEAWTVLKNLYFRMELRSKERIFYALNKCNESLATFVEGGSIDFKKSVEFFIFVKLVYKFAILVGIVGNIVFLNKANY